MDTFSPPIPPAYDGTAITEAPRLRTVSFGDGYKQTAPDGLNANDATATYEWPLLNSDQYNYIVNFYMTHIGAAFLWDAPGDVGGSGKWAITSFKKSIAGYNWYAVTMGLERRFDLA